MKKSRYTEEQIIGVLKDGPQRVANQLRLDNVTESFHSRSVMGRSSIRHRLKFGS